MVSYYTCICHHKISKQHEASIGYQRDFHINILQDTFHILSVKTEEFLNDEAKTVLFAELYVALKHLQEMGITIYSRINSRDNELYIARYELRELFEELVNELYPRHNLTI